ncbi:formate--tetrahydrofolate ligase [Oxyplasma meridianum]|uniref:Formate--tetrahydrofolate ligase n=1 Tax=Oxyplasma meridianum TaxID=3073602 RepID=A0AAX4NHK0_9ARCH
MENFNLKNIKDVVDPIGIRDEELETYGNYMAKVSLGILERLRNKDDGKLILVTSINPTPAGEGKTTTSIGLTEALGSMGKKVIVAIREPSLGPCFGIKGGATGGGKATVEPSDRINLFFTSDFPAVTAAHNLLSALINNHIHYGNDLRIDPKKILFPRTIDMNDRSLREVIVGTGGHENGSMVEDKYVITPASEIMAIVGLAEGYSDLKERLSRILVAYSTDNRPIYAGDLNAQGSMAVLLRDAIKPNIVQTAEGNPAFIHTGPFGNIAHGTSSILADRIALKLADYVVTEAGFGSELGAEKFFNLVSRVGKLPINGVVLVCTIRALKHHGGARDYNIEDLDALKDGSRNLLRHVENIRRFGFDPVVSLNIFASDSEKEIKLIGSIMDSKKIKWARSEVFEKGGKGGLELASKILENLQDHPMIKRTYEFTQPLQEKIESIVTQVYGGTSVEYSKQAKLAIKKIKQLGLEGLPICMAKNQYSFSDDASKLNAPENFKVNVRDIRIASGAGFLVPMLGEIMTMPGLPKVPAANGMDVDEKGNITGL